MMVIGNDCLTPGRDDAQEINDGVTNSYEAMLAERDAEITRLTQELEAAEAKGRDTAANWHEEQFEKHRRACAFNRRNGLADDPGTKRHAQHMEFHRLSYEAIRALKAPAIGSQGTEKEGQDRKAREVLGDPRIAVTPRSHQEPDSKEG